MSGRPGATGGPLRLGTRKSLMATTQSQRVADLLTERTGRAVELVGVTTQGDVSKALVAQMGGTGVFVNALRDKILSGEVDFAVHSLKDLPTSETPGIALAATPARDDPRDALCSPVKLADLPHGARVGTGSPRRIAQLRALRPDLEVIPIRGNADTRLAKVTDGDLDAVVLAHAGLRRIGRVEAVGEVFDTDQMLPAPGQGALALECRSDRADLLELLGTVNDAATRRAVTAERTILAVLEAGCSAPVGTYAAEVEEELHLTATVAAYDGSRQIRLSASGHPDAAEQIGRDLADRLLAQGADQLMGERD
ncbi:hydroxymethylbilane synthase [Actinomadura catellatispora]|uniref:Porphobilinogen deaminase n=1 Tax=Actinomadura livida TaxID=79909 RepID=A0A7W7IJS7_9ACTN|nr:MULTISPECIES: hydroxymethylbilane synthase [Actinomadura]MBB4778364.1 hydroxymethylbilane synthase [Actinomadura catellatispora]